MRSLDDISAEPNSALPNNSAPPNSSLPSSSLPSSSSASSSSASSSPSNNVQTLSPLVGIDWSNKGTISVRASIIGERIVIKALDQIEALATNPLIIRAGATGCAVILRYGVMVTFDLSREEESESDTPGKAGGLMNVTASKADAPPKVSDCESFSDCAA